MIQIKCSTFVVHPFTITAPRRRCSEKVLACLRTFHFVIATTNRARNAGYNQRERARGGRKREDIMTKSKIMAGGWRAG